MGAAEAAGDKSAVFRHGGFFVICLVRQPGYGLPWNLYNTNGWIYCTLSLQSYAHVVWYIFVLVPCTQ